MYRSLFPRDVLAEVDRLQREFGVEANVGKPEVAFRETIRRSAEAESKYVKQTGGRGQYGHVVLTVEPSEPNKGFEFVNKIVGGVIPREFIPAVEKGVKERLDADQHGVAAGQDGGKSACRPECDADANQHEDQE